MTKFVTAAEAVALISDRATVAVSGHAGFGTPDGLFKALRDRYNATHHPQALTLVKLASTGDKGVRGGSRLAADGLIDTLITSHVGLEPALVTYIQENKCLTYTLPAGTMIRLYRAIAAGAKGIWTDIGLRTLADPRLEGCKGNVRTALEGEDIVSLMQIDGKEYLYYKTFPIQVCLIRGSIADEDGNISLQREAMIGEQLEIAEAVHNSGGIVIVQVEQLVPQGTLDPRLVKIHHFLVDYVVVPRPKYHYQSFSCHGYRPELTGDTRKKVSVMPHHMLDNRKICARRAAMELKKDSFINLGIGMPEIIGAVAAEEGFGHRLTLSTDSGIIGGFPLSDMDMGAAVNPEAELKMADMFDIYDGGGLDVSALGLAEIDRNGNVNVSKFHGRVIGPGGFINISQNTKKLILMGTFTAGGLREQCAQGRLQIEREGRYKKFKKQVEQITFSGPYAAARHQEVIIVTERAVFTLTAQGLMLTEIAPGMDLERNILGQMEFQPLISPALTVMDVRIFKDEVMGLKDEI